MLNAFRRSRSSYGSIAPTLSPYAKAANDWDNRIGNARVQAHNWRLMAFGSLGLAAISRRFYLHREQHADRDLRRSRERARTAWPHCAGRPELPAFNL